MVKVRHLIFALAFCTSALASGPVLASDESDVQTTIDKWVSDFNKGDMKAFVGACAPHAAIVDGFSPYAWTSCADWMRGYEASNKVLKATHGALSIGKPVYAEVNGDCAYAVYPATFADTQDGKPVVYKGTWTITLHKTNGRWAFTGSGSAWGGNYTVSSD